MCPTCFLLAPQRRIEGQYTIVDNDVTEESRDVVEYSKRSGESGAPKQEKDEELPEVHVFMRAYMPPSRAQEVVSRSLPREI